MSYTCESSVSTAGWWQLANKLGRNGRKRWEAHAQGSLDDTLEMLSNEHNDAMTTACDICSSEKRFKKACRGGGGYRMPDWQILLINLCAHCSVWCGLASVLKEVSGRLKHQGEEVVKLLQILCLGVRRDGSSRRTWLWQSAMSSATLS